MTRTEYEHMLWQDQDEEFFKFCETEQLDHTDPHIFNIFLNALESVVECQE